MGGLLSENDRASACAPTGEPPAVIEAFFWDAVGASALLGSVDIEGSTVRALANTIPVTIVFSIIAHGITARPLTTLYVKQSTALNVERPTRPATLYGKQSTALNVERPTRPAQTCEVELPGCALTVGSIYLLSPHGHHDDSTDVGDRAALG
jgi:hypothetical protein